MWESSLKIEILNSNRLKKHEKFSRIEIEFLSVNSFWLVGNPIESKSRTQRSLVLQYRQFASQRDLQGVTTVGMRLAGSRSAAVFVFVAISLFRGIARNKKSRKGTKAPFLSSHRDNEKNRSARVSKMQINNADAEYLIQQCPQVKAATPRV